MIKQLLFRSGIVVFLLGAAGTRSFSQVGYQPFPTISGTWTVSYNDVTTTSPYADMTRYVVGIDTVIGSYTYKKVDSSHYSGPGAGLTYGSYHFCFAYRNDVPAKQVYLYKKIGGVFKDTLWYDFNMVVGDTAAGLPYSLDTTTFPNPPVVVSETDSILVCGVYHKRFFFNNCNNGYLVEGIGYSTFFLRSTNAELCYFEPTFLHTTNFNCLSLSVAELMDRDQEGIWLFPNPAVSDIEMKSEKNNLAFPVTYSIIDCTGRKVSEGNCMENQKLTISSLDQGVYFLLVTDRKKNVFRERFIKR